MSREVSVEPLSGFFAGSFQTGGVGRRGLLPPALAAAVCSLRKVTDNKGAWLVLRSTYGSHRRGGVGVRRRKGGGVWDMKKKGSRYFKNRGWWSEEEGGMEGWRMLRGSESWRQGGGGAGPLQPLLWMLTD